MRSQETRLEMKEFWKVDMKRSFCGSRVPRQNFVAWLMLVLFFLMLRAGVGSLINCVVVGCSLKMFQV
jgi:hypothetical protein